MIETGIYFVTEEIAERSGLIDSRYRIIGGRFVLDNKDLSRVRFTPDEYISGLDGVERVTLDEAKREIARNNYQMGRPTRLENQEPQNLETSEDEQPANTENDNEEGQVQDDVDNVAGEQDGTTDEDGGEQDEE